MLASYLGHFRGAITTRLWQTLWREFDFLGRYFDYDAARVVLRRRYDVPAGLPTVRAQYRWIARQFRECAVFLPVGRFCESYAFGTPAWVAALGLKPMRANRRGARHSFPLHQRERHRATLLRRGVPVLECEARPRPGRVLLARVPAVRHAYRTPIAAGC